MKTFLTLTAIGMIAASAAFSSGITAPKFERPKLIAPKNTDPFKPNPDCPHKHISQDCDHEPEPRDDKCASLGLLRVTYQEECE